ncbi:MAG: efflux RND transporter periplasmic adaptor subunit [Thermodesulfovibrionales bacterium]|nr:efflux RND transporter periplasmic adaptor subunit [Thermodesulfovibrionales bacterium]
MKINKGINMKSRFVILIVLMLSLLFFTSCKKKEVKAPAEKAVNVRVHAAEKKSLRPFLDTTGTLNPYEEVIVSAEVDGILKGMKVSEGSIVSKGTILAVIDDIDYDLEVKKVDAALKQADANLANTKLEYQRKNALFKEQLVTQQQFDDVSTRLSLAAAEVERATASLSLAKQKLLKTLIYSPLAGVVKEKKVERGNYVKNGTALFTIIQTNPIKLNFSVPEKDTGKLKAGQNVFFTVDAFPQREFKGKVSVIYPSLEEKTRTLLIEALVPNPSGILKPGLFSHVTLHTGSERGIVLVPITALLYEGEKIRVFVAEGDRAKERTVKIGQQYKLQSSVRSPQPPGNEYIEIIEGVKEGELIVTVGQQNLFEGAKVNVAR